MLSDSTVWWLFIDMLLTRHPNPTKHLYIYMATDTLSRVLRYENNTRWLWELELVLYLDLDIARALRQAEISQMWEDAFYKVINTCGSHLSVADRLASWSIHDVLGHRLLDRLLPEQQQTKKLLNSVYRKNYPNGYYK